jgi:hypothetical protein
MYISKLVFDAITGVVSDAATSRNITEFVKHIKSDFDSSWGRVKYNYTLDLNVFTKIESAIGPEYKIVNPLYDRILSVVQLIAGSSIGGDGTLDMILGQVQDVFNRMTIWDEMMDSDIVSEQYDIIDGGTMPKNEVYTDENGVKTAEIVLVLNEYNQINDLMALALGDLEMPDMLLALLNYQANPDNPYSKLDDATGEYVPLEILEQTFAEVKKKEFWLLPTDARFVDLNDTQDNSYGFSVTDDDTASSNNDSQRYLDLINDLQPNY